MSETKKRWPSSVYAVGNEPDPRFTLANERTFLAWVRTSIAIIAIGVAIDELEVGANEALRMVVVFALILLGLALAFYSFFRWMKIEAAMREAAPLPSLISGFGIAISFVVIAVLIALLTVS